MTFKRSEGDIRRPVLTSKESPRERMTHRAKAEQMDHLRENQALHDSSISRRPTLEEIDQHIKSINEKHKKELDERPTEDEIKQYLKKRKREDEIEYKKRIKALDKEYEGRVSLADRPKILNVAKNIDPDIIDGIQYQTGVLREGHKKLKDACQEFSHFRGVRNNATYIQKFGNLDANQAVNDDKATDALIKISRLLNDGETVKPSDRLYRERNNMNKRFRDAGVEEVGLRSL